MSLPGSACLACGGPTRLKYRARKHGAVPPDELRCTSPYLAEYDDVWSCPACGLAYQIFDDHRDALVARYAAVEDPDYLTEETHRREEFRALLSRVEDFKPERGRLLEVGSYAGLCLDEARTRGWEPTGVEPSRWAVAHARSAYGAHVIEGSLSSVGADAGTFDAVVAWDVLEHLKDPLADLRRARSLLAPGGVVALTTVNISGLSARVLRGRWPWLMRMHLWYFTSTSLRLLFARAGLEVVAVETHPKRLSANYVIDRAQRWAGPVARGAKAVAERFALSDHVLRIDLGDILLAIGRVSTLHS